MCKCITKQCALKIVFVISIIGVLFSGFLSYGELFNGLCQTRGCATILGLPVCVYGFLMYLLVFIVSWTGLISRK